MVPCRRRLLNEVAAAKVCLLNPERKAAYDAQFHGSRQRQTDCCSGLRAERLSRRWRTLVAAIRATAPSAHASQASSREAVALALKIRMPVVAIVAVVRCRGRYFCSAIIGLKQRRVLLRQRKMRPIAVLQDKAVTRRKPKHMESWLLREEGVRRLSHAAECLSEVSPVTVASAQSSSPTAGGRTKPSARAGSTPTMAVKSSRAPKADAASEAEVGWRRAARCSVG